MTIADVANPVPSVNIGGLNDKLERFASLGMDDILASLDTLVGFLEELETFQIMGYELPLINRSMSDIVGYAGKFESALANFKANPAATLQQVESFLESALGGGDDLFTLSYFDAPGSDPDMLKVVLNPRAEYRIYLDIKDTRGAAKVRKLHEVLCNNQYDFSRSIIHRVQQIRSHEVELLQLADLMIGAVAYANRGLSGNPAKGQIVEMMRRRSGYSLSQTTLLKEQLAESRRSINSIFYLVQGFVALGLFIGIAALGLITIRAVVERRQQIGVLRAIGFQREMVQAVFLVENLFVGGLASFIGYALALTFAYNLYLQVAADQGLPFAPPWPTLLAIGVGVFAAALVTAWLHSRRSAQVVIAEALRYQA